MSIVTPYGQLDYGSETGLTDWIAAHEAQHRLYAQVLALAGRAFGSQPMNTTKITPDWLLRNLLNHTAIRQAVTPDNPNPTVDLADTDWETEGKFYRWHQAHDDDHAWMDQVLGIAGNSF